MDKIYSPYSYEVKAQALALAEALGPTEAARQTGVPRDTVKRWRKEARRAEGKSRRMLPLDPSLDPARDQNAVNTLYDQALGVALDEASEYIADRLKNMADKMYDLAVKAVDKINVAISDPDEVPVGKKAEPHDKDGAAWVRALVGVMAQSLDKAQLLSGKPTARPEVVERHEYDITQRIITERPDLIDAIFAIKD